MSSLRAERQLILLSAGTAARRQEMRERGRRLAVEVEWARLAGTLLGRNLLPALGPRIMELAGDRADDGFAAAVKRSLEAGRRQSAVLQLLTLRAMAMLADAGIRCSPLKGPLLGEAIYGELGRRLSGDIDLLVAPEQLTRAVEVVRELGYGAPSDHLPEDGLPRLHFRLLDERRKLPPVELHWRVHWYERSFANDRLLTPAVDPRGEWRPARADELAGLLLFYARDGFIDLRMAGDVGAWWDVYGVDLSQGALDPLLSAYPALARVVVAALAVAERVVGLPAADLIGGTHGLGPRERVAVRLANPNPRSSQSQLYADAGLIDGLLAPVGGFGAFVHRQLLLPAEVRGQQARHGAKPRVRSQLGRCAGMLGRYALTVARLARASETSPVS
jgi:hypothetical protein